VLPGSGDGWRAANCGVQHAAKIDKRLRCRRLPAVAQTVCGLALRRARRDWKFLVREETIPCLQTWANRALALTAPHGTRPSLPGYLLRTGITL